MLFLMTLNQNHVFVNIVIILEHYLTEKKTGYWARTYYILKLGND